MTSELESVTDLVRRWAAAPAGAQFRDILTAADWSLQSAQGGSNRQTWTKQSVRGFLKLTADPAHFSVVVKFHDPDEEEDLEALTEEFEAAFETAVADLAESFGAPSVRSEYDEPPVPTEGEYLLAAVWAQPRRFVLGFQQEDKEIPLRITANIVI